MGAPRKSLPQGASDVVTPLMLPDYFSRLLQMQRLGQARDRRDKSECDSAVYSSLRGTHTGLAFGLFWIF